MKERGILYSAPMIRAKLAGIKTQTRRIMKPQPIDGILPRGCQIKPSADANDPPYGVGKVLWNLYCPYDKGDQLYGKEQHRYHGFTEDGEPQIEYAADGAIKLCKVPSESQDRVQDIWAKLSEPARFNIHNRACDIAWRPSIHMPRWASRIVDVITEIRVQRVQDISEADAIAEGMQAPGIPAALTNRSAYARLWNEINGKGSWESNPWVWAITTKPFSEAAQ